MGKRWFITGATRGLGKSIAQAALRAGDEVVATGRSREGLESAYLEADQKPYLVEMDVGEVVQIEHAVDDVLDYLGGIDILVNNAGFGQLGLFETISDEAIAQQFATNVFGLMAVTRKVLPAMREAGSGHIFNLSSIGGTLGFDGASVYCASKFAVEGFSESLALELARFNIGVTIVEPGFFRTDFLDGASVRYGDIALDDYARVSDEQQNTYAQYNHAQPGDPEKLAAHLVACAHSPQPPLRFVAGADALEMSRNVLRARSEELELGAAVAASMQFDS